jgi:hypothetical protein
VGAAGEVDPSITAEHGRRAFIRRAVEAMAQSFGVSLTATDVQDPAEIERAIEAFAREPNGGLIVLPGPITINHREMIIALAARHHLPAVDEMGVPGIYVDFWHGLWAPKGTPKDIIANRAVVDVLADDTVRKRFADQGQEIPPRDQQTPAALHAFQQADIEKWWPMIKAAGIKAEN